jgi:hypothetical protein
MTNLFLFFLIWPFHHKPAPPAPIPAPAHAPGVWTAYGLVHFPDSDCGKTDDGYFVFIGPDSMAGVSQVSCDGAFADWQKNDAPRIRSYRVKYKS